MHLEGLGYFSLSIDGEVERDKNNQLRLKNPRVRSVKFLPEEQMMQQMQQLSFSCQGHKGRQSRLQDEVGVNKVIESLLQEKPFFTARDFFTAAQVTDATGYRILRKLVAEKKIKNIGTNSHKIYTTYQETDKG